MCYNNQQNNVSIITALYVITDQQQNEYFRKQDYNLLSSIIYNIYLNHTTVQ